MMRRAGGWSALLAVLAAAAALVGCSGGLSTEEAEQRCGQERAANATQCVTDEGFAQCVACYEECGDDCTRSESCPAEFVCAE